MSHSSVSQGITSRCDWSLIALTGFIAGQSCLPNESIHLGWLAVFGLLAARRIDLRVAWHALHQSSLALPTIALLSWMTLRSCFISADNDAGIAAEMVRGLSGLVLLLLFLLLVCEMAKTPARWLVVARWFGVVSVIAACVSVVVMGFLTPGRVITSRLENVFVHGGLNPVVTGLVFGFAAMWLSCTRELETSRGARRWNMLATALLLLAVLLTASRGAMLALFCGHAVMIAARGWRRAAPAVALFALTVALFFCSTPLLDRIARWQHGRTGAESSSPAPRPLRDIINRTDSGRLAIYRAGIASLASPAAWLIGNGQWGSRSRWQRNLGSQPGELRQHLHSIAVATLVSGGMIGVTLLFFLVLRGARHTWHVARAGDATWIILLAYGCGGLLFDGETITSLASLPRCEALLFWLPMVGSIRATASPQ